MSLAAGAALLGNRLHPHRRALVMLTTWSLVEALPAFVSGLFVAQALDQGFLRGDPLSGFTWLAALAALYAIGSLGTRQVYPRLADTVEPLRDSLVTEVVQASLRRALGGDTDAAGSGASQATVQVETVRALFSTLLRNMRQLVVSSIAAIAGLTVLSPLLALVAGGCVLVALALFCLLLPRLVARERAVVLLGEQVGAAAAPVFAGMRDVVACAGEQRAEREVGAVVESAAAAERSFARAWVLRLPIVTLGAHLPLLILLALSPWLVADGRLTIGQVAGGAVYLFSGLQPAIQVLVSTGGTVLTSLGVVLARLAETCQQPASTGEQAALSPARHDLDVAGATFAYSDHATPVISDLDLAIPAGRHLAVVGPSGAGKSTLANLLAGLVVPQRGSITLGGTPLETVDRRHLRRTVALIPQEAYVFAGTVRENLSYLRPEAPTAAIDDAVVRIGLEGTLARLGGVDGEIEPNGGTLSPGECQLIALARVYLSTADVVILDEGTCHLDPVAEARAEQAFAMRGGTLVVIAHRMSSALRAEEILCMDGTNLIHGTHDELLRSSRTYAELVGYWTDTPYDARA
ncbi:MAG: ABC transporter ATP-binding protein [Streptosporangiales bacterium]